MALKDKQELFCNEYIIDFNATQAAIRAGYSFKTACAIGTENLRKPNILSRIEELKKDVFSAVGITQSKVYRELRRLGLSDIRNMYDDNNVLKNIKDMDDDTAAAIVGVEVDELWKYDEILECKVLVGQTVKVKLGDKKGALDSLVKIAGWSAPEKINVTTTPTTIKAPDGTIITI